VTESLYFAFFLIPGFAFDCVYAYLRKYTGVFFTFVSYRHFDVMFYWTARRTVHANLAKDVADIIGDVAVADVDVMYNTEPASDYVTDVGHIYDADSTAGTLCAEISEHHELLRHFSSTTDESVAGHEHADNLSVVDSCDIDDVVFSDVSDGDSDSDNCLYDGIVTVLCNWAVKYSVRRNAMSQLLVILREHFPELPKDARTFLPTVNDVEMDTVKLVSKGSYYHFGVENGICSVLESHDFDQLKCASEVSLQVDVDGLPLFKSTNG